MSADKTEKSTMDFLPLLVGAIAVAADAYMAHATIVLATDDYVVSWCMATVLALVIAVGSLIAGQLRVRGDNRMSTILLSSVGTACLVIFALRLVCGVSAGGGSTGNALSQASGSSDGSIPNFLVAFGQLILMAVTCFFTYTSAKSSEEKAKEEKIAALTGEWNDLESYFRAMSACPDLFEAEVVIDEGNREYEVKRAEIESAFDLLCSRVELLFMDKGLPIEDCQEIQEMTVAKDKDRPETPDGI